MVSNVLMVVALVSLFSWQSRSNDDKQNQYRHVLYRAILENVLAKGV